jgi:hypothetical protein
MVSTTTKRRQKEQKKTLGWFCSNRKRGEGTEKKPF